MAPKKKEVAQPVNKRLVDWMVDLLKDNLQKLVSRASITSPRAFVTVYMTIFRKLVSRVSITSPRALSSAMQELSSSIVASVASVLLGIW